MPTSSVLQSDVSCSDQVGGTYECFLTLLKLVLSVNLFQVIHYCCGFAVIDDSTCCQIDSPLNALWRRVLNGYADGLSVAVGG